MSKLLNLHVLELLSISFLSFNVFRVCLDILFSFLILVLFPSFCLPALLDVCQFYWPFQRMDSLFHWLISIVYFFYFNDFWCHIYYFLLFFFFFCFGFILFIFFSVLEVEVYMIYLKFFLMSALIAVPFLLSTDSAVHHKFWYAVFSFSFI